MVYRTKTYIAADFDNDKDAVDIYTNGMIVNIGAFISRMRMNFNRAMIVVYIVQLRNL